MIRRSNPNATVAPRAKASAGERVRDEIDAALEDLYRLSSSDVSERAFYDALLARLCRLTGASTAVTWIAGAGGSLEPLYRHGFDGFTSAQASRFLDRQRSQLAGAMTLSGAAWQANHQSGRDEEPQSIVCPVKSYGELWGLVMLHFPQPAPEGAQAGLLQVVEAAASVAGRRMQGNRAPKDLSSELGDARRLAEFSLAVQSSWSVADTAEAIVDEGQRLLGCDRMSVHLRRAGKWRLTAVGGVGRPNRRSPTVKRLEQLVSAATKLRQSLFYEQGAGDIPPQVEKPLDAYLDESGTRTLAVIPLFRNGAVTSSRRPKPFAAIIVEQMSHRPLGEIIPMATVVSRLAETALDRATSLRNIPVVGRLVAKSSFRGMVNRRWVPLWLVAAAAMAAGVASLFIVETELRVPLRGRAAPVEERRIFAPAAGIVAEVFVESEAEVAAAQKLVQLKSPELELKLTDLVGQADTLRNRQRAIRSDLTQVEDEDSLRRSELAAEEKSIDLQIASLKRQYELLQRETAALTVTSPIQGAILEWNVRQSLQSRPVARGDVLMTVADLAGEWRLEFDAPDALAGLLLEAQEQSRRPLRITYVSTGDPQRTRTATLRRIRETSSWNPQEQQSCVVVEADFTKADIAGVRPGLAVVGKVDCGRRSLAYVWFHDFYYELLRRFF